MVGYRDLDHDCELCRAYLRSECRTSAVAIISRKLLSRPRLITEIPVWRRKWVSAVIVCSPSPSISEPSTWKARRLQRTGHAGEHCWLIMEIIANAGKILYDIDAQT